jgi:hypothetical protein
LAIAAARFLSCLHRSFHSFLKRRLRSIAYLHSVLNRGRLGLRLYRSCLLARRRCWFGRKSGLNRSSMVLNNIGYRIGHLRGPSCLMDFIGWNDKTLSLFQLFSGALLVSTNLFCHAAHCPATGSASIFLIIAAISGLLINIFHTSPVR